MKNAVKVSIKKPCLENFTNFSTTRNGGFCSSCQEEVIDFTSMSSAEIGNHFRNTSATTCGRFKASQLTRPTMKHSVNTNLVSRGMAIMSFSLLSLCAVSPATAQEVANNDQTIKTALSSTTQNMVMGKIAVQSYTVKGVVLDEENLPLPGANVFLKGTKVGVSTDFDGKFEFPEPLETGDILLFSYLGYETKEYVVPASTKNVLDITINFAFADVELMGEVVIGGVYTSKRTFFQKVADLFR